MTLSAERPMPETSKSRRPGLVEMVLDEDGRPLCDPPDGCSVCVLFTGQRQGETRSTWLARLRDGAYERGAILNPQSDGYRVHALPCGSVAGPDHGGLTADEMPGDSEIDMSNRLAARRRDEARTVEAAHAHT